MSDAGTEPVQIWEEFCELLKSAGEVLRRDELPLTELDRAEGLRYLSRLVTAGFHSFMENPGPFHPRFRKMPDTVKMGIDNPDNFYLGAPVHADRTYRITGTRSTIHYLSFAAQNQNFAARERLEGGAGHLMAEDLELADDGTFEILASQAEQAGNWLRMAPDTSMVLCRQTFLDKASETPVDLEIECLDVDDPAPPLELSRMPHALGGAAMYAMGCAQWFYDWIVEFDEKAPRNAFHLPDREQHNRVGGDPNVRMWLGRWELEPGEALVIDATPPRCDYWNFQLANIWGESLDYETRPVHVNMHTATYRDDGSFRLVVSHTDTGHPNWMDTTGHAHGTMALRWVRTDEHPEPRTRVVADDDPVARSDDD